MGRGKRWSFHPLVVATAVCLGIVFAGSVAAAETPQRIEFGPPTTGQPVDVALADLESVAQRRWPETFGGIWGSGSADRTQIFVAFTKGAIENVEALADDFPEPDLLVPVQVSRSLADLEATQLKLIADREAARVGENQIEGLSGVNYDLDVDRRRNVVVMIIPRSLREQLDQIRQDVTVAYGEGVTVEEGPLAHPQACQDRFTCGLQLRAGIGARFIKAGTGTASSCTDAFVVTRPGGAVQILSAGHCADYANGNPDIGNGRYHRAGIIPANLYGSVQDQYEGGRVDAERHSIGNGFGGNPWIFLTQEVQANPIKSVGTWNGIIVYGGELCKGGVGSGYSCGYVASNEYSPGYIPNGNRFLALEAYSTFGDSGAPFVWAGTHAEAIISGGGGGTCGCWTIAGHIEYANEKLGVYPMLAP